MPSGTTGQDSLAQHYYGSGIKQPPTRHKEEVDACYSTREELHGSACLSSDHLSNPSIGAIELRSTRCIPAAADVAQHVLKTYASSRLELASGCQVTYYCRRTNIPPSIRALKSAGHLRAVHLRVGIYTLTFPMATAGCSNNCFPTRIIPLRLTSQLSRNVRISFQGHSIGHPG